MQQVHVELLQHYEHVPMINTPYNLLLVNGCLMATITPYDLWLLKGCLMAKIRHATASCLLGESTMVSISRQLLGKSLKWVQCVYLDGGLGLVMSC